MPIPCTCSSEKKKTLLPEDPYRKAGVLLLQSVCVCVCVGVCVVIVFFISCSAVKVTSATMKRLLYMYIMPALPYVYLKRRRRGGQGRTVTDGDLEKGRKEGRKGGRGKPSWAPCMLLPSLSYPRKHFSLFLQLL